MMTEANHGVELMSLAAGVPIPENWLSCFLAKLSGRDRGIMQGRFGLLGSDPKTFRVLGEEFNLSGERTRQIQNKVIRTIRRELFIELNQLHSPGPTIS